MHLVLMNKFFLSNQLEIDYFINDQCDVFFFFYAHKQIELIFHEFQHKIYESSKV